MSARGGRGARARRLALVGLGALLVVTAGCSGPVGSWGRRRLLDTFDVVPASIAVGWGASASVRASHLLQGGLGLTPVVSRRYGYTDRTVWGLWDEYVAAFPWSLWEGPLPERTADHGGWLRGDPARLLYRWQVFRDVPPAERGESSPWEPVLTRWGRHPPVGREEYGALLFPPGLRREIRYVDVQREGRDPSPLQSLSAPKTATLWQAERTGNRLTPDWGLLEVDVFFVALGLRVGLRPVELVDLLAGLVGADPMGDDDIGLERASPRVPAEAGDEERAPPPGPPEAPPPDDDAGAPDDAPTPPEGERARPLFPVDPIPLEPLEGPAQTEPAPGSREAPPDGRSPRP